MDNRSFSISEKSAMLALMMIGRKVSNPDIRAAYGFVIDKPIRESLVAQGLIKADKGYRGVISHELTEAGWRRCREQFAEETPSGAQKKDRLLYGFARWTGMVLARTDLTFADLIDEPPAEDPPAEPPPADLPLDERVLDAYRALAADPGAWVGLAELRARLPDVPRAEFDEALRRIAAMPHALYTPEVNQKTLTEADRQAAVQLGGEDKHLLSVQGA